MLQCFSYFYPYLFRSKLPNLASLGPILKNLTQIWSTGQVNARNTENGPRNLVNRTLYRPIVTSGTQLFCWLQSMCLIPDVFCSKMPVTRPLLVIQKIREDSRIFMYTRTLCHENFIFRTYGVVVALGKPASGFTSKMLLIPDECT